MVARDVDEAHRSATPLELLFDLTLVVAVAQVARELAHDIAEDHLLDGLGVYAMAFFAIWWAWMNFTWFASAYDCDDVGYRLLTLLQMAGVLVLAAGVPAMFEDKDFRAATVGYVVMRIALVAQWLRAAHGDPERRPTARRYATGVALLQAAWLARLALPEGPAFAGFFVLVALEMATPWWAERTGTTRWHPHHIAERYGLFTIIVLGESVLAATTAAEGAVSADGLSVALVVTGAGSLALLFALWWVYFLKDSAAGLARHRELAFLWGYGHYVVFASLAAVGAGLEVAAEAIGHEIPASDTLVAMTVAVPVSLFLLVVWALHAPLGGTPAHGLLRMLPAVVACFVVVALVAAGLPLAWAVVLLCVPLAVLVAEHHWGRDEAALSPVGRDA
jgi:low temperature requirement protein LtrA